MHSARLCAICQHSPLGTCGIPDLTCVLNISATNFPPTNSKDSTIKLPSARCCESTSLTKHNCECAQVSFRCGSGKTPAFSFTSVKPPTNLIPFDSPCLKDCPQSLLPVVVSSSSRRGSRSYPLSAWRTSLTLRLLTCRRVVPCPTLCG